MGVLLLWLKVLCDLCVRCECATRARAKVTDTAVASFVWESGMPCQCAIYCACVLLLALLKEMNLEWHMHECDALLASTSSPQPA